MATFSLEPQNVEKIQTKYRTIQTQLPHPEAAAILEEMRRYEPVSMTGQPPVIWDKAVGYTVSDRWGNRWIDFSSGVVVANAGHCNPDVQKAAGDLIAHGLMHTYLFPNEQRARLVKKISEIVPIPDNRVFLLSTGAESTECAIKLARTYGISKNSRKVKIVTFDDCFHGRTMGSQQAGGTPSAKTWIGQLDPNFVQVPFPNAFKYDWADTSRSDYSDQNCFDHFAAYLQEKNVSFDEIAAIMTETFQGGWVQLMPKGFVHLLRRFCSKHDILLVFDEVQAGFGRTGKLFGFQYADVTPDLICCGKGVSSGMPLSCVVGRAEIMNQYGPNKMTSTHSGNPVCAASAYASIHYVLDHHLVEHAFDMGGVCKEKLNALQKRFPGHIGFVSGCGLAWAVIFTRPGTKEMDCDLAQRVVELCMQRGLLFFAPVGCGSTLKVVPPLVIDREALEEGLAVLEGAVADAVKELYERLLQFTML